MTDLTDRGYTKIGEIKGLPIWQDNNGDRWVEHTEARQGDSVLIDIKNVKWSKHDTQDASSMTHEVIPKPKAAEEK